MLKRTYLSITRNKLKTLLLTLLFIIINTFVFFALTINTATDVMYTDTLKQIGSAVSITQFSEMTEDWELIQSTQELTLVNIDEILAIENVIGVEAGDGNSKSIVYPLNFSNSKEYTGSNPLEQTASEANSIGLELYTEAVSMLGYMNIEYVEFFSRGLSTLVQGEFPTDENPGAIVSEQLAQQNNLSIGDTLKFQRIIDDTYTDFEAGITYGSVYLNDEIFEVEIIGIYSTDLTFDINGNTGMGSAIFEKSPYNFIYVNYETGLNINSYSLPESYPYLTIIVDEPSNVNGVIEEINNTSIDMTEFEVYNKFDFHSDILALFDDQINNVYTMLLVCVAAGVVLFLLIFSSLNANKDISVLLCVKERKSKIILQKTLENLIIAIPCAAAAIYIAIFVASTLTATLTPEIAVSTSYTYSLGIDYVIPTIAPQITTNNILLLLAYNMVLALIGAVVMAIKVQRNSLKTIFDMEG